MPISSATESVNTVTITTTQAHGFTVGESVTITGVTLAGYNGIFTILTTPTTTTFTYTDNNITNAASSSSGTATGATGNTFSAPVSLGSQEGIVTTNNGLVTVSGVISGTNGLTVGGGGTLALNKADNIPSTNAVQTLTYTPTPTAGAFTLTFNGQTTAAISGIGAVGVVAAAIQTGLNAMANMGATGVLVTSTATTIVITFQNALAGVPQSLITMTVTTAFVGGNLTAPVSTTPGVNSTTTLNSGTLTLGANNAVAGGSLNLTGGTLLASTPVNLTNTVNLSNSSVTIGGSSAIVFSGPMNLAGLGNILTVTNTAQTFLTGVLQDAASEPGPQPDQDRDRHADTGGHQHVHRS